MATTTPMDHDSRKRWVVYTAAGLIFLVLLVIMVAAYRGAEQNDAARQKAEQLAAVITKAGYPAPDTDAIAGVLGDDGGAVCADPADALRRATLYSMIANGATGPGARPVRGDTVLVRGQRAIITIYCPDQLAAFEAKVKDLKLASVAVDPAS